MLPEWIVIGGVLFWGILAVLSFVAMISIHNRCEGFALTALGLFAVVCILFGDLYPWAIANASVLIWCAVAYPLIGVAWSFPRWFLFLDRVKSEYKSQLAEFGKLSKDKWGEWGRVVVCSWSLYDAGLQFDAETGKLTPPPFHSNKERIFGWMLLWPWSMLDALLGELVFRVLRWVRDSLQRFYQAISDKMFSEI